MRREKLIESLDRINKDIVESGINDMIRSAIDSTRIDKSRTKIISVKEFHKYSILSSTYDRNEIQILKILGLSNLVDVDFWERSMDSPELPELFSLNNSIRNSLNLVPRILELIQQEYKAELQSHSPHLPKELQNKELITVIISEDKGKFSSPQRLVLAIESISGLYELHAKLLNEDFDGLIVLSCDSGSDKSFDFLGVAEVIRHVKETIISIYDRVVLHRHNKNKASLELIAQSLPIFEKIDELKQSQSLSPEEAELLRRNTMTACTKFIETGITIPEMEHESVNSPRMLMAPSQKLITGPSSNDNSDDLEVASSINSSDNEEPDSDEELRKMVRKMQQELAEIKAVRSNTTEEKRPVGRRRQSKPGTV